MYFMYVDESGDPGGTAITSHFVLTGLIIHHEKWRDYYYKIKEFRRKLKTDYGINLYSEIHATDIWRTGTTKHLSRAKRASLFTDILFFIRNSDDLKIITVSVNKKKYSGDEQVHERAWKFLIQRYENFLLEESEYGLIFNDEGYENTINTLVRKMAVHNHIPSRWGGSENKPIKQILEDTNSRDSSRSYFIQLADICCYFCRLRDDSGEKQREYKLHKKYRILKPRLLRKASPGDNYGFVYINR